MGSFSLVSTYYSSSMLSNKHFHHLSNTKIKVFKRLNVIKKQVSHAIQVKEHDSKKDKQLKTKDFIDTSIDVLVRVTPNALASIGY